MSNVWFWHCDHVLPDSASRYWKTVWHLIQMLAPLTTVSLTRNSYAPSPPLCPIVYWWITSHHTPLTPWRHHFLSFMEMQSGKIDEEKTEDDFSKPYGHCVLSLCTDLVEPGTLFSSLRLSAPCFSCLSAFEGGHVKSITQSAQWSKAHLPVDSF